MRSPFAYVPRRRPLQLASPGAAVAYLGAIVVVAFAYSNPLVLAGAAVAATLAGLLAGARAPVRAGWRMGLSLLVLIAVVNALVSHRGETVLARLGHWPVVGQGDVTLEAIVEGLNLGLRALVAMVAFAVYSSCVDPDRVLRALRPLAGRSALTATLVSRLVPVAAADAARLRDAAALRGPGAAAVGRAPLARRLLAGSLDRAVDVAATLELRGYSLDAPRAGSRRRSDRLQRPRHDRHGSPLDRWRSRSRDAGPPGSRDNRSPGPRDNRPPRSRDNRSPRSHDNRSPRRDDRRPWPSDDRPPGSRDNRRPWPLGRRRAQAAGRRRSRYDRRFYATGALVLAGAIAGKLLGADGFHAYPTIHIELGGATIALAALVALSGLAPLRRRSRARVRPAHGPKSRIPPADGPNGPTSRDKSARRRVGFDESARRGEAARV